MQYDGEYLNSDYHGNGTYYNSHDEIVYTGVFKEGRISESVADREARVAAFKDTSVPLDIGDIYGSCQEEVSMHIEFTGKIFDLRFYPSDTDRDFCDVLIYERGKEDTGHIIWVLYLLSEEEPTPVIGQQVTVWGTTENLYTYTTTENKELTVPLIEAWSVE